MLPYTCAADGTRQQQRLPQLHPFGDQTPVLKIPTSPPGYIEQVAVALTITRQRH
jgi:hypothetical protein